MRRGADLKLLGFYIYFFELAHLFQCFEEVFVSGSQKIAVRYHKKN